LLATHLPVHSSQPTAPSPQLPAHSSQPTAPSLQLPTPSSPSSQLTARLPSALRTRMTLANLPSCRKKSTSSRNPPGPPSGPPSRPPSRPWGSLAVTPRGWCSLVPPVLVSWHWHSHSHSHSHSHPHSRPHPHPHSHTHWHWHCASARQLVNATPYVSFFLLERFGDVERPSSSLYPVTASLPAPTSFCSLRSA
jgi:hypothetical protein